MSDFAQSTILDAIAANQAAELDELENMLLVEGDVLKVALRTIKLKREEIEQQGTGPRLVG